VVAVGRGDVDDVDVGVGHQLVVGTVGLGRAGGLDLGEELSGAVLGAGRRGGGDLMAHVVHIARGRVGEEVLGEDCRRGAGQRVLREKQASVGVYLPSAIQPVAMIPHLTEYGVDDAMAVV
jgi:hypothetical protein